MNESTIITGNALSSLKNIADECVDCCVTSPPYYGLRDYGIQNQIGLEETVQEYIEKLILVFREVRRVLKDDGTLWLNIGDSYAGSGKGRNSDGSVPDSIYHCKEQNVKGRITGKLTKNVTSDYKPKDLMGVPWLLAFALQANGWYLRQDIIWNKTNCMPESVKDRCTRSHEYIFLLSKSRRYYFDYEAIKEPAITSDRSSPRGSKGTFTKNSGRRKQEELGKRTYTGFNERYYSKESPQMRNKRDVWSVPTSGCKDAHFATYPEKLIEPCILAGSKEGGIVLDPFLGSGTTAIVAVKNDRKYIGIEINPQYVEMAQSRIKKWFNKE